MRDCYLREVINLAKNMPNEEFLKRAILAIFGKIKTMVPAVKITKTGAHFMTHNGITPQHKLGTHIKIKPIEVASLGTRWCSIAFKPGGKRLKLQKKGGESQSA